MEKTINRRFSLKGDRRPFPGSDGQTMKRSKKNIVVRIILASVLLFCGLNIAHVDVKQSEISATSLFNKTFIMESGAVLYAGETGKYPEGEHRSDGGQEKKMPDSNSPTEGTRGYVTPLRILSVIAMSIFLVWYIRRKLKL
jgi:hypothetical protein